MKLRKLSYIFLAFSLLGVSLVMNAKVKKSTVYMFGFSASFTDSLVYTGVSLTLVSFASMPLIISIISLT